MYSLQWALCQDGGRMDDTKLKNVFDHPPGVIPIFNSLESFRDYMFAMREQTQKEKAASER